MGSKSSTQNGAVTRPVASGSKVVDAKLQSAAKTGVLNLADQNLKPSSSAWLKLGAEVYVVKLKTLDISGNQIKMIPIEVYALTNLKNLFVTRCCLQATHSLANLARVTNLKLDHNDLEASTVGFLPPLLQQLNLSYNHLVSIPPVLSASTSIVQLDLSCNRIESVEGVSCLINLVELNLDDNMLTELPREMEQLRRLHKLSLRRNRIYPKSISQQGQSIPVGLLRDTDLSSLNLEGNPGITKDNVLAFEGIDKLLERLKSTADKNFAGGALHESSLFGLN